MIPGYEAEISLCYFLECFKHAHLPGRVYKGIAPNTVLIRYSTSHALTPSRKTLEIEFIDCMADLPSRIRPVLWSEYHRTGDISYLDAVIKLFHQSAVYEVIRVLQHPSEGSLGYNRNRVDEVSALFRRRIEHHTGTHIDRRIPF